MKSHSHLAKFHHPTSPLHTFRSKAYESKEKLNRHTYNILQKILANQMSQDAFDFIGQPFDLPKHPECILSKFYPNKSSLP